MSSAECVSSSDEGQGFLGRVEMKFQGREITALKSLPIESALDNPALQNGGMSLRDLLDRELTDPEVAKDVASTRRRLGSTKQQHGLAKLRLSTGLSQQQVADAMGVQQPAIARWERNPSGIAADRMLALASALNLSMADVAQAIEEQLTTPLRTAHAE